MSYIICKKHCYPLKYSDHREINYYTGIYKLKDMLFILCDSLEGDFSKELDLKAIKSYEHFLKEAEEKNKCDKLDDIIRKCLDV